MAQVLWMFSWEDKDPPPILHSQHHGWWWPGDISIVNTILKLWEFWNPRLLISSNRGMRDKILELKYPQGVYSWSRSISNKSHTSVWRFFFKTVLHVPSQNSSLPQLKMAVLIWDPIKSDSASPDATHYANEVLFHPMCIIKQFSQGLA